MAIDFTESGLYAVGHFIELTREERIDQKTGMKTNADYALISTGGRRGIIALKFDPAVLPVEAFKTLSNAALGDEIAFKMSLSCMDKVIYYRAEDAAALAAVLEVD